LGNNVWHSCAPGGKKEKGGKGHLSKNATPGGGGNFSKVGEKKKTGKDGINLKRLQRATSVAGNRS